MVSSSDRDGTFQPYLLKVVWGNQIDCVSDIFIDVSDRYEISPSMPAGETGFNRVVTGTNFIPASNFYYHFVVQIPFSDWDGMALFFAHPAT